MVPQKVSHAHPWMSPGDDVTVYGVMHLRWKPLYDGAHCDVELVLKANNVEVNNQQMADALLIKDVQKDFEEFWSSYEHDPITGEDGCPGDAAIDWINFQK